MPFGRPTPEQRAAERAAQRSANLKALATVPARCLHRGTYEGTTAAAVPKEDILRSEAYRRLVAAMPCWNCKASPPTQAAHPNNGKGMALKTDDRRCFPLCPQCHGRWDQGGERLKQARRVLEDAAERDTRAAILAAGTWPKNLPMWKEEPCA